MILMRHGGCYGIKLFKWKTHQLEVWCAPFGTRIEPHCHVLIDSNIIFLAGRMWGVIGGKCGVVGWTDCFRRFHVPAGTIHSAFVLGWFALFANWETWAKGYEVTSAAVDFYPA